MGKNKKKKLNESHPVEEQALDQTNHADQGAQVVETETQALELNAEAAAQESQDNNPSLDDSTERVQEANSQVVPEIEEVALESAGEAQELAPTEESATALPTVPKITDLNEIERALEAVIFASPRAISLQRLKNLLGSFHYDTSGLTDLLKSMEQKMETRGFQLVKVAGGYQFRTHPSTADLLQKLLEDKPARLGQSALEVLSIVAYKQPITRAEIDSVRGVDSGHLIKGLLEKNLIRTQGHAETAGRPLLYGTAPYFLEVFSLGSLDELPSVEEFERELPSDSAEAAVLAPELGALGAEPDRGVFDQIPEESVHAAEFGVDERALEEVQA